MSRLRLGSLQLDEVRRNSLPLGHHKRPLNRSPASAGRVVLSDAIHRGGEEAALESIRGLNEIKSKVTRILQSYDSQPPLSVDDDGPSESLASRVEHHEMLMQYNALVQEKDDLRLEVRLLRDELRRLHEDKPPSPTPQLEGTHLHQDDIADLKDVNVQTDAPTPFPLIPPPRTSASTVGWDQVDLTPGNDLNEHYSKLFRAVVMTLPPAPPSDAPTGDEVGFVRVDFESKILQRLLRYLPGDVLEGMGKAVQTLRRLSEAMHGYETVCDSPTSLGFVFPDADTAVTFSGRAHTALLMVDWTRELLADPDAAVRRAPRAVDLLWRGIGARIGCHCGKGLSTYDGTVGRAFYYGHDVHKVAALTQLARVGETLCSMKAFKASSAPGDLLRFSSKSIDEDVVQVLPAPLAPRAFPPMDTTIDSVLQETTPAFPTSKPPTGNVTMLFLDIYMGQTLWKHNTEAMVEASHLLKQAIHSLSVQYRGYRVREEKDGCMVAFANELEGLQFALELNNQLLELPWPEQVLEMDLCKPCSTDGVELWRGPRVRIGMHKGYPTCLPDPTTGAMTYWGPMVTKAARLCGLAAGGQILASQDVVSADARKCIPMHVQPLPPVEIPGFRGEFAACQVLPARLAKRKDELLPLRSQPFSVWDTSDVISRRKMELAAAILQHSGSLVQVEASQVTETTKVMATLRERTREVGAAHAPTGVVSLVCLEVVGNDELWEALPGPMISTQQLFVERVSGTANTTGGYLARQDRGACLVAFSDELEAVQFCLQLQMDLMEVTWPKEVADHPACTQSGTNSKLWNGPRVAMGAHTGRPTCLPNPATGRLEYWGPAVNKAARVSALAKGGEVLVTRKLWKGISHQKHQWLATQPFRPHVVESYGVPVNGLRNAVDLVRLTPMPLKGREFGRFECSSAALEETRGRKSLWVPSALTDRGKIEKSIEVLRHLTGIFGSDLPSDLDYPGDAIEAVAGPPVGQVALVFTDIQSSTALWEKQPDVMMHSIQLHNTIMRRLIAKHSGYEVKTEGDAFMVSFTKEVNAVLFCLEAQVELVKAPWMPELLEMDPLTAIIPAPGTSEGVGTGRWLWRGLRMRMGVHSGCPTCIPDPVSGRMDYWGPMVNKSARISSVATGGQVVISSTVLKECSVALEEHGVVVKDLGMFELKGIKGSSQIYEVLAAPLRDRVFEVKGKRPEPPPPPPLLKLETADGDDVGDRSSSETERGGEKGLRKRRSVKTPKSPRREESRQDSRRGSTDTTGSLSDIASKRHRSPSPGGDDDFRWTIPGSQYISMSRMARAAEVQKLIVGGLLPSPPSSTPESREERHEPSRLDVYSEIRGKMEADAMCGSETPRKTVCFDTASRKSQGTTEHAPQAPSPPLMKRSSFRRASIDSTDTCDDLMKTVGTTCTTAQSISLGSFNSLPPSKTSTFAEGTLPQTVPELTALALQLREENQSLRTELGKRPLSRRNSGCSSRRSSCDETELTRGVSLVKGIYDLQRTRRRRSSVGEESQDSGPGSEESVTHEDAALTARVQRGLMEMVEEIERNRMEQEDSFLHPNDKRERPAPLQVNKTEMFMRRFLRCKYVGEDIWDKIDLQSTRNELLGFSFLHQQVSRLHQVIISSLAKGPLDIREYKYNCLFCVNPRSAKVIGRSGALDEAIRHHEKEILSSQELKNTHSISVLRKSIIGMILQWSQWIGGEHLPGGGQGAGEPLHDGIESSPTTSVLPAPSPPPSRKNERRQTVGTAKELSVTSEPVQRPRAISSGGTGLRLQGKLFGDMGEVLGKSVGIARPSLPTLMRTSFHKSPGESGHTMGPVAPRRVTPPKHPLGHGSLWEAREQQRAKPVHMGAE